ncbi:hypothetical protein C4K04_4462 [Pseudomonas chlororaphis]|uniref:Uncharacterized protein n=1 Tax=Pseudomonas chlororaphis TaxID=587753 RepID=A0A3G7TT99_9PSED|nr:hypothetical protein C4K04_4462 [Pseudomonas chlororaphis]
MSAFKVSLSRCSLRSLHPPHTTRQRRLPPNFKRAIQRYYFKYLKNTNLEHFLYN